MKVTSYYNVVPSKNKSQEKTDILVKFIKGVNAVGDKGVIHHGYDIVDSDVAVIQGWVHERGKSGAHLKLREQVIDTQIKQNRFVISGDSNLFLYSNPSNKPHHYLRYSFNGVFPNTGIYCDNIIDHNRWEQVLGHHNIVIEKYKKPGRHILFCLQRNGGWSMGPLDVQDWALRTIKQIRQYTDRPIVIRAHPGDKKAIEYLNHRYSRLNKIKNVSISNFGKSLDEDLYKCHAVVNHNSSSIVGPIIKGYPAFITDPIQSQCAEVTHHNFKDIENPQRFDRLPWIKRLSMFHWNFEELENGTCWRHMRNYCQ